MIKMVTILRHSVQGDPKSKLLLIIKKC